MSRVLRSSLQFILFTSLFSACFSGCATVQKLEASSASKYEGFIHDGETSKQKITDRLGQASSIYENGRILIYHVYLNEDGQMILNGKGTCHALVLVFNDNALLEKHSFIKHGCQ